MGSRIAYRLKWISEWKNFSRRQRDERWNTSGVSLRKEAPSPEEHTSSRSEVERKQVQSPGRCTTRAAHIEEQSHQRQRLAGTTLPSRESHGAYPGPPLGDGGRRSMQDRLEAEVEVKAREIKAS